MTSSAQAAPWYRSMLFVPGHKFEWMSSAPRYGADALIFDLEDSVPADQKGTARLSVAQALSELKGGSFGKFVRINSWNTGLLVQDVLAVVHEGLDGLLLSKTEAAEDIAALDRVLNDLERSRGLRVGSIEIIPDAESAQAMYRLYDICTASARVRRVGSGAVASNGGDITRALGIEVNEMGDESLYFSAYLVLQARAAGITQITGAMTFKLGDLDLVRRVAVQSKRFGATGARAIHPSHIPILNEVYSPSSQEITVARETVAAMARAVAGGDAATAYRGEMVDYAHARSSVQLLAKAKELGLDVGDIIGEQSLLTDRGVQDV